MAVLHVVLASFKGGVGRTTLAAQLCARLTALGKRCMGVDLDPQNALSLHLSESPASWVLSSAGAAAPIQALRGGVGLVQPDLTAHGLAEIMRARRARVAHLPFGEHDAQQRARMEQEFRQHPARLAERLRALSPPRCDVLVLDTPAFSNVWLEAALHLADLALVPVLAEPACLATVPALEAYLCSRMAGEHYYVVNRFNPTRQLSIDVYDVLQGGLPGRVLDFVIHEDESMREQLARGLPLALDEGSQVAADLDALARFVAEQQDALSSHELEAHAS